MTRIYRAIGAALLFATILHGTAGAQEITNRKKREEIITKARALVAGAALPGLRSLHCTVRSESITALYDSLWRASPETSRVEAFSAATFPLEPLSISIPIAGEPSIEMDRIKYPPYEDGAHTFMSRLDAFDFYLHGVFIFWLHLDEMAFGTSTKKYRVWREKGGYRVDATDRRETIRTHLTSDHVVSSVNIVTSDGTTGTVTPAFTWVGERLRLDSLHLNISTHGYVGFMTLRYSYVAIDGHLLPESVAVRAEGMFPATNGGRPDLPMDETLTFGDYRLYKD